MSGIVILNFINSQSYCSSSRWQRWCKLDGDDILPSVSTLKTIDDNRGDVAMRICTTWYQVIYQPVDIKSTLYALCDHPLEPKYSDLD